ncbi:hypothetical protein Tco_1201713 [Tanacetum coccineum]
MLKSELEKLKQEKESNQLKIENFDNASKSLDKLIGSQITDNSRKGVGFVSYNVVPPPLTGLFSPPNLDLSNFGLEEFQQPKFEGYGLKTSRSVSKDVSNEVKESPNATLVKELVSDDKLEKKTIFPTAAKIEFANCSYYQRERVVSGNNYTRVNYNYSAQKDHPSAQRNMVPRVVLMKTSLRTLKTARPVNTAHPKTTVYNARPMSRFSKSAQSTIKRPYQTRKALNSKNFSQKVNITKGKFYTTRPKAVNTTRPNTTVVNALQGRPQKEDQGYVDSGCSRHMTGNMSYLSATQSLLFTWVFFFASKDETSGILKSFITQIENLVDKKVIHKRRSRLCCSGIPSHIQGTCPISQTSRNLMEDMLPLGEEPNEGKLLVKELLKLMCDKKNSVLFTDTGCFVLSPDFKLADESQATLDESMLWHRRLGHWNGYLRKGRKTKPKRQNRTRNGKARKR